MTSPAETRPLAEEIPDTSMPWRRAITTAFAAAAILMCWRLEERATDPRLMREFFRIMAGTNLILLLTYFTGATLLDWAALVTALRAKRTVLEHASNRNSHDAAGPTDAPSGA